MGTKFLSSMAVKKRRGKGQQLKEGRRHGRQMFLLSVSACLPQSLAAKTRDILFYLVTLRVRNSCRLELCDYSIPCGMGRGHPVVLSGQMGWLEESKMASLTCLASWDDQKVGFSRVHQPERHTHGLSSLTASG